MPLMPTNPQCTPRFLDNVTTDIIHYESKKVGFILSSSTSGSHPPWVWQLVYYPGNLSSFVEQHPEAKSYYTLAATSVRFSFPSPGSLMGVRSNTRAILKLSNCTFTYPGRIKPSLYNVSCALSLSRWVSMEHTSNRLTSFIVVSGLSDPMVLESQH